MDMREMVDRVKRGESLYGTTELSDYMQGVAARNSRYTGVFLHVIPMFNFVNHNQVCSHALNLKRSRSTKKTSSTVWTQPSTINKQSVNWKPTD